MTETLPDSNKVELFPQERRTTVADEPGRILALLRDTCPAGTHISFDFDGRLHVHVDVRSGETMAVVEAILPVLGQGLFHTFSRGKTPKHPFFHRISALVDA